MMMKGECCEYALSHCIHQRGSFPLLFDWLPETRYVFAQLKKKVTMKDSKAIIRAFIGRFFQTATIQDDQDIFAVGFVNSLFAIQLITFIEKEFAITIENEELQIDNFRTLNAIERLLATKARPANLDIVTSTREE